MFNPPTRRHRIKQAERRIVPISRQTALTPDIKKAALERNTRVLREKKIKVLLPFAELFLKTFLYLFPNNLFVKNYLNNHEDSH